jgi:hypothetical protein
MDKIKELLGKQQVFWSVCGVVVVASLVCWFIATSGLSSDTKKNAGTVTRHLKQLRGISKIEEHPNQDGIDDKKKETEEEKERVLDHWKKIRDEQVAQVFRWPKELGPEFAEAIARLKKDEELPAPHLDKYLSFVDKWFPRMAVRVMYGVPAGEEFSRKRGALVDWGDIQQKEQPAAGEELPAADKELAENGTVSAVNAGHFGWRERPITLKVQYAQEDLWALEALCEAIIRTNKDAKGAHDVIVRAIREIEVAKKAVEKSPGGLGERLLEKFSPAAPPRQAGGRGGGRQRRGRQGRGNQDRGRSDPEEAKRKKERAKLKADRYVDADGNALPADKEFAKEYRILPARLVVTMDVRKVGRLLEELANSRLLIEVTSVRMNPGAKPGKNKNSDLSPYYQTIQIQAHIFLVNEVDFKHLGLPVPKEEPKVPTQPSTEPAAKQSPEATAKQDGPPPAAEPKQINDPGAKLPVAVKPAANQANGAAAPVAAP